MPDWYLKLVILGDDEKGKKNLRQRIGATFREDDVTSLGIEFAISEKIIDGEEIELQFWEPSTQVRFKTMRKRSHKKALGGLCIYDVAHEESFMNISEWIEELWQYNGNGIIPIILLGNIVDKKQKRCVTIKQGKAYAETLSMITEPYGFEVHYMDISTKTGDNIDFAINTITKQIIEVIKKGILNY